MESSDSPYNIGLHTVESGHFLFLKKNLSCGYPPLFVYSLTANHENYELEQQMIPVNFKTQFAMINIRRPLPMSSLPKHTFSLRNKKMPHWVPILIFGKIWCKSDI